jgi:hypothetical protein
MKNLKPFSDYLYKKIKVITDDDTIFEGTVQDFGGKIQGYEENNKSQSYIELYNDKNALLTVLFENEIKDIEIL